MPQINRTATARRWFMGLAVFFAISLSGPAFAAASYDEALDAFFSLLTEGKASEAIGGLIATNPNWYAGGEGIAETTSKLELLPETFGAYTGRERIGLYEYSSRIHVLTYLMYNAEASLRMEFIFYKPENEWKIINFNFGEVSSEELIENARAGVFRSITDK
ncbi:hypothetical protein [Desulfonatronum lacustre]|uniref:hypothetical protein n=1 Tax=Desulfonatronum lacustre TaxID=66849 RepID=UPI00048C11C2|nr:hypothetical protein [Desulfonatronum lacustre]SMP66490.1 hypothetical protein SAMN06295888_11419 [Desulfonatronum zhilinae]